MLTPRLPEFPLGPRIRHNDAPGARVDTIGRTPRLREPPREAGLDAESAQKSRQNNSAASSRPAESMASTLQIRRPVDPLWRS